MSLAIRSRTWTRHDENPISSPSTWIGANTSGSSVCADDQYG